MPEDRRLAAIMFTDIVGYTALMGSDEDQAFEVLSINREIHISIIKRFHGNLIKEMGDGILASFSSNSDAVRCAIEIQQEAKMENIKLRIGIHEGEVVFVGADVLGDGVNVASRLEEMAEEGCINISGAVHKDIKNKKGISARFIEERKLKNVEDPVKVYKVEYEQEMIERSNIRSQIPIKSQFPIDKNARIWVIVMGLLVIGIALILIWQFYPVDRKGDLEKSIAVLPLDYLSEDPNKIYLADGVMDAITGHLSKIEGLRVMPRTSVEQYRESTKTSEQISRELEVSYLVEGSFLMVEDSVTLIIQLIIGEENDHLFFNEYKRDYSDIISVQSELAKTIAREIGITISPEVKERIETKPTEDHEAYDDYLRGRSFHNQPGDQNLNTAIHFYRQAIDRDPQFALAYTWLGEALYDKHWEENYLSEDYPVDTLLYFAEKAIGLNPELARGYLLKGYYHFYTGDVEKSGDQYQRALELNPNLLDAYNALSFYYRSKGQFLDAIKTLLKAIPLTKGSEDYIDQLGRVGSSYLDICDYERAEEIYRDVIKLNPLKGYGSMTWLYRTKGDWDQYLVYIDKRCSLDSSQCLFELFHYNLNVKNFSKALSIFEQISLNEDNVWYYNNQHRIGYLFHNLGDKELAADFFKKQIEICLESIELKRHYSTSGFAQYDLAGVYAFIGEKEKAYQLIQEVDDRLISGLIRSIQVDPLFENLWADQEFKDIIAEQEEKRARIRAELDRLESQGKL